ncbi:MAG: hypothetical protein ACLGIA_03235 [Actinomycetes bacterium]
MERGRAEPAEMSAPSSGSPRRRTRRRLVGVAGLFVALLAGGVVGAAVLSPGRVPVLDVGTPRTVSAAAPTSRAEQVRQDALRDLLERRGRAVTDRDAGEWMSTVDAAAPDFAARQGQVFANLAGVPFATWRYEYLGEAAPLSPQRLLQLGTDDAWVARVVLEYQLAGTDTGVVRREQYLTVVDRSGRWLLTGDSDGRTAVDLWDLGPVHLVRGERAVVVGTADPALLTELAPEVDAAATHVDTVEGQGWPRALVVMVPRDQSEMAALLGRDTTKGLDQIAAVTTGEMAGVDGSATSANRVIINPEGFTALGPLGRKVVLRHEITHLATRAGSTASVPLWLSEGFADYVAYVGTGLDRREVGRDVLTLVREGRSPAELPGARDFDPASGDIAPAYAGAWVAVQLIADRYGQEQLVRFYREASGSTTGSPRQAGTSPSDGASSAPLAAAFRSVLGTDEATFTRQWRDELARLAAG